MQILAHVSESLEDVSSTLPKSPDTIDISSDQQMETYGSS